MFLCGTVLLSAGETLLVVGGRVVKGQCEGKHISSLIPGSLVKLLSLQHLKMCTIDSSTGRIRMYREGGRPGRGMRIRECRMDYSGRE